MKLEIDAYIWIKLVKLAGEKKISPEKLAVELLEKKVETTPSIF